MSRSYKLALEKPKGSNENPAGHPNNTTEVVPVLENSNSVAISDLGCGDTPADPSKAAKSIVYKPF